MKAITKEQSKKMHTLLGQLNLMDSKRDMIHDITNGRTTSSKEMTFMEARLLISYLIDRDGSDRMRGKIFALAYEAGIIYGDTPEDKKMNTAKLNLFLKSRGTVKKEVHKLSHSELVKTVNQFQSMVKHQMESKDNKNAKSITDDLLKELNLSTK